VVVLSGKVSERDIVRAIELGADDFVTKPYKPLELSARIRRCINNAKHR
jgi:DNA-binding response OmpR family regulator